MRIDYSHRLLKYMIENGKNVSQDCTYDDLPKAVYATQCYKNGDVVRKLEGILVLEPTRESIHIGNGMHVIDKFGKYINHSFDSNTKIYLNNIIAIKDIKSHDEITFNYNESEIDMAVPFKVYGIEVSGVKQTPYELRGTLPDPNTIVTPF